MRTPLRGVCGLCVRRVVRCGLSRPSVRARARMTMTARETRHAARLLEGGGNSARVYLSGSCGSPTIATTATMTGVPFMKGPFSLPSKEAKEAEKKKRVRAMPSPAPLACRSRARPIANERPSSPKFSRLAAALTLDPPPRPGRDRASEEVGGAAHAPGVPRGPQMRRRRLRGSSCPRDFSARPSVPSSFAFDRSISLAVLSIHWSPYDPVREVDADP